jgi:hypothetical protein
VTAVARGSALSSSKVAIRFEGGETNPKRSQAPSHTMHEEGRIGRILGARSGNLRKEGRASQPLLTPARQQPEDVREELLVNFPRARFISDVAVSHEGLENLPGLIIRGGGRHGPLEVPDEREQLIAVREFCDGVRPERCWHTPGTLDCAKEVLDQHQILLLSWTPTPKPLPDLDPWGLVRVRMTLLSRDARCAGESKVQRKPLIRPLVIDGLRENVEREGIAQGYPALPHLDLLEKTIVSRCERLDNAIDILAGFKQQGLVVPQREPPGDRDVRLVDEAADGPPRVLRARRREERGGHRL